MPLHQLLGPLDAGRDDAGGGILLERLAEGAALAAIEGEHRGVGRDAGERLVDHRARDAGARRLASHGGQEAVEIAAALAPRAAGAARASVHRRAANTRAIMPVLVVAMGGSIALLAPVPNTENNDLILGGRIDVAQDIGRSTKRHDQLARAANVGSATALGRGSQALHCAVENRDDALRRSPIFVLEECMQPFDVG